MLPFVVNALRNTRTTKPNLEGNFCFCPFFITLISSSLNQLILVIYVLVTMSIVFNVTRIESSVNIIDIWFYVSIPFCCDLSFHPTEVSVDERCFCPLVCTVGASRSLIAARSRARRPPPRPCRRPSSSCQPRRKASRYDCLHAFCADALYGL